MKKVLVSGLVLLLLLVFIPITQAADYKIGFVTGTVSQSEEEYHGALNMIAKYGADRFIHVTYPDNFMVEQETTIAQMTRVGLDPKVKAVVVCQGVPGTTPAFERIKKFRDDVLFIVGLPLEDPDMVAGAADLVLNTNDLARGITIAQMAHRMGAKKLLHYSFPRHMSMELLAQRFDIMKEEAESLGLEVIQVTAPDPMGDAGIPGTQQFVIEDIPRQAALHGKDIAIFGTNCSMMEPMISTVLREGLIFPEQCCPSPYHGYPGALGIEIPEDKAGDVDFILEQIRLKVAEYDGTGRFATWVTPMVMSFIEIGTVAAMEILEGGELDFADADALAQFIEERTGVAMQLERYGDIGAYYLCIAESVIF